MIKFKSKKSILKFFTAIVSVLAIVASTIIFAFFTPADITVIRNVKNRNTIVTKSEKPEVHYAESANSFSEKITSSGLIELSVDPKSKSFGIFETATGRLWSALPLLSEVADGEDLLTDASMASVKILVGSDIYHLNTQDNSLAFNKATYKKIENGAEFTFDMFPDSKTAVKKNYEKDDIGFRITVTVSLKDGSMLINCNHKNLTNNPKAFIDSIDLLNYFGAYNSSLEDDFLLVPDGCGAIIKTSIYDESFETLSFAVYGKDPSIGNTATGSAVLPAFGIKHGETAFVSLIENGDTAATIKAEKATSLTEFNRVFSSFLITPSTYKNNKVYISNKTLADNISLCYRFLTGNNATYAGLASACREQLIRNSILSTKTVSLSDYIPCFLSLTGSISDGIGKESITTFEQATDMLSHMKSKGINNISVRYSGVFDSGINSKDAKDTDISKKLGGSQGLNELYEYTKSQKMQIYLDINPISSSSGFRNNNVMNLNKKPTAYSPDYISADFFGSEIKSRNLRNPDNISETVKKIIKSTEGLSFSGFCINDAGTLLYSDFSKDGILRNEAAKIIASSVAPLSTEKSTMAVTGNFYMLKNVDSIVNLPLKTTSIVSGAYVSVPFVPLVMHGIVDYTGEPINTQINIDETLLKYVEYGACPHFEWSYEPVRNDEKTDIYYYDNTINVAAEYYKKVDDTLNDLRDARMTDHYQVADGIFCTEYDTGSLVYVNYTDKDFETLGVTVEAKNFLRVN